jgi:hypothetical protein
MVNQVPKHSLHINKSFELSEDGVMRLLELRLVQGFKLSNHLILFLIVKG